jgi:hypothetical protein
VWQVLNESLPGQNLAPAPELRSSYASHDFIPVLDQVWPSHIEENTKEEIERVCREHVAQELIRNVFTSASWQIADFKNSVIAYNPFFEWREKYEPEFR